jgi:hypothetical protein
VTETQQAAYYARVVQLYACDPSIQTVLFFHLIDETNLDVTLTSGGWQSGLEYPDGTPKPSYNAVRAAIAAGCTGAPTTWSPVVVQRPKTAPKIARHTPPRVTPHHTPGSKPKRHHLLKPKRHPKPKHHKPKPHHRRHKHRRHH